MKRIFLISLLITALLFSFTGCGKSSPSGFYEANVSDPIVGDTYFGMQFNKDDTFSFTMTTFGEDVTDSGTFAVAKDGTLFLTSNEGILNWIGLSFGYDSKLDAVTVGSEGEQLAILPKSKSKKSEKSSGGKSDAAISLAGTYESGERQLLLASDSTYCIILPDEDSEYTDKLFVEEYGTYKVAKDKITFNREELNQASEKKSSKYSCDYSLKDGSLTLFTDKSNGTLWLSNDSIEASVSQYSCNSPYGLYYWCEGDINTYSRSSAAKYLQLASDNTYEFCDSIWNFEGNSGVSLITEYGDFELSGNSISFTALIADGLEEGQIKKYSEKFEAKDGYLTIAGQNWKKYRHFFETASDGTTRTEFNDRDPYEIFYDYTLFRGVAYNYGESAINGIICFASDDNTNYWLYDLLTDGSICGPFAQSKDNLASIEYAGELGEILYYIYLKEAYTLPFTCKVTADKGGTVDVNGSSYPYKAWTVEFNGHLNKYHISEDDHHSIWKEADANSQNTVNGFVRVSCSPLDENWDKENSAGQPQSSTSTSTASSQVGTTTNASQDKSAQDYVADFANDFAKSNGYTVDNITLFASDSNNNYWVYWIYAGGICGPYVQSKSNPSDIKSADELGDILYCIYVNENGCSPLTFTASKGSPGTITTDDGLINYLSWFINWNGSSIEYLKSDDEDATIWKAINDSQVTPIGNQYIYW